jgi:hypothetical protein
LLCQWPNLGILKKNQNLSKLISTTSINAKRIRDSKTSFYLDIGGLEVDKEVITDGETRGNSNTKSTKP